MGISDAIRRSHHEPEAPDVLGDLMRGTLDHCVKCTICETFCPVSNVTPLFPGPKYVGPQAERFRVGDEPSPGASLDYCAGCGICTQVCPQGVHIAEINTQARAHLKATNGVPLRDRIIARPTLTGRLGTPVAPLRCRASPAARSSAGRGATPRLRPATASSSSTAAAPTTTSRGWAR